jgi:hypothetical protein
MGARFVVTRGGREAFCTVEELQQQAAAGLLHPSDRVLHPVLGWLPASEVPELERALATAAELGRPPRPPAPPARRPRPGSLFGALLVAGALGLLGAAMIKERRQPRGPTPLADGPPAPTATTGVLIVTSNAPVVRLYRDDRHTSSALLAEGTRPQIELPADVELRLRVEADGYAPTTVAVRLRGGQTRTMPIGLTQVPMNHQYITHPGQP